MLRQNRKIQFIILLTLVCLVGTISIAYAVLSTTLNITGNTEVIASSWNVHFNNISINQSSVEATKTPTIIDSKTIDFSVKLDKPGDFYKFNVDIVNDGSIDAMIESVIKSPDLTTDQAKYIKYEIEYINGQSISTKQLLKSGETKTISILLSYRTDITSTDLPTTPTTLNLSIELNYIQADTTSTEVTTSPKKINVKTGDLNTVGSEICIGEECFYLMSNDGYSVTMLSKYNLHIGNIITDSNWQKTVLENPTGIQDESARAIQWNEDQTQYIFPLVGTENFALTNYWVNTVTNYPYYVYNSSSAIYDYIENYKSFLESKLVKVEEARLIKYEELNNLGCNYINHSCSNAPKWVYGTSYWTGTAKDVEYVYAVYSSSVFVVDLYYYWGTLGVRPVIEIPLTEF